MAYVALAAGWVLFGAVHSLLAASSFKNGAVRLMGSYGKYYRLLYNLVATGTLLAVLYYQAGFPAEPLWRGWTLPGAVLVVGGSLVLVLALRHYDLSEFMGTDVLSPKAEAGPEPLRTGGLLRYVRHPLYTGTLLILWGIVLARPALSHLIAAVVLSLYIRIGISLEEKKLVRQFGQKYLDYKRKVPMLFPSLNRKYHRRPDRDR